MAAGILLDVAVGMGVRAGDGVSVAGAVGVGLGDGVNDGDGVAVGEVAVAALADESTTGVSSVTEATLL